MTLCHGTNVWPSGRFSKLRRWHTWNLDGFSKHNLLLNLSWLDTNTNRTIPYRNRSSRTFVSMWQLNQTMCMQCTNKHITWTIIMWEAFRIAPNVNAAYLLTYEMHQWRWIIIEMRSMHRQQLISCLRSGRRTRSRLPAMQNGMETRTNWPATWVRSFTVTSQPVQSWTGFEKIISLWDRHWNVVERSRVLHGHRAKPAPKPGPSQVPEATERQVVRCRKAYCQRWTHENADCRHHGTHNWPPVLSTLLASHPRFLSHAVLHSTANLSRVLSAALHRHLCAHEK